MGDPWFWFCWFSYFAIIGNGRSINRFYLWAMECTFKWLNRRGGKRMSFTQETFWRAVDRGLFRKPRIMAGSPRRVFGWIPCFAR